MQGTLTAAYLKQTTLRGITLGGIWAGSGGDAAIERLLAFHQAKAERILGVAFCSKRVRTFPDSDQVFGDDYDMVGDVVPYVAASGTPSTYLVPIRFGPLRSLDRVRVFQGYNTDMPAAP